MKLAADQLPLHEHAMVLQSFESTVHGGDQGPNSKLNEQDVELTTGRSGSGTSGVGDQRTYPYNFSTASTDADASRAQASTLRFSIAGSDIVSNGGGEGRSCAAAATATGVRRGFRYGEESEHTNMEDQRQVLGVGSSRAHMKESSEPRVMREQVVALDGDDQDAAERWDPTVAVADQDRASIQRGEQREPAVMNWSNQSRSHARDVTVVADHDFQWRYQQAGEQLRAAAAAAGAHTDDSPDKWGDFAVKGRKEKDSEPPAAWVSLEAGAPPRVMYRECQKNLAADRGVSAIDGCGEFMASGREGKNALTCAACGCHRNFHRRVQLGDHQGKDHDDEEQQQQHEKEGAGDNEHVTSICKIERVAHELMAAATRTIPLLSQELPCSHHHHLHHAGRVQEDLFIRERNLMAKISVENLDHIAKLMLSTAEYLTLLQKLSSNTTTTTCDIHITASSGHEQGVQELDKFNVGAAASPPPLPCVAEAQGPISSDVSPVSTVEKRGSAAAAPMPAMSLSLQPCNMGVCIGGVQALALASHQHQHHRHQHHATVGTTMQGTVSATGGSSQRLFLEQGGASEVAAAMTAATQKFKRKRTRITEEQRHKLNLFAERAGWTVVGQRKETIDAACADIGIEPKTLKYWIHNSKQKFKRELDSEDVAMQGGH